MLTVSGCRILPLEPFCWALLVILDVNHLGIDPSRNFPRRAEVRKTKVRCEGSMFRCSFPVKLLRSLPASGCPMLFQIYINLEIIM